MLACVREKRFEIDSAQLVRLSEATESHAKLNSSERRLLHFPSICSARLRAIGSENLIGLVGK